MKITPTRLPEVLIVEPKSFSDSRGYFMETYHETRYAEAGIPDQFVQDNLSLSSKGVLRGLHYQYPHGQGKLISALAGEVLDVAVDVRVGSPTFGQWISVTLSEENKRQLYVPEGFAHGFCVTSESALFLYKCTDYYHPECEGTVLWNDADIGIEWPVSEALISDKDGTGGSLRDISPDRLPKYEGNRN